MKNGDMPAMPIGDGLVGMGSVNDTVIGLTKREYFAALPMQGIVTGSEAYGHDLADDDVAGYSVRLADALLAGLEQGLGEDQ